VSPEVFIPLAEESGLILALGRQVLHAACAQASRWHQRHPELRPGVAVNVSRRQLVDPTFADQVAQVLAQSGLPADALTLEVTESVLGSDPERVVRVLRRIRTSGVRVAIDDFGTGYSSFAALAELPIDTLKIDKRFIDNLSDQRGRGLVEAITRLARTLVLDTTAEGVEDAEQLRALEHLGCDRIQGYLYSRPLSPEDADRYLASTVADRSSMSTETTSDDVTA
jgi:EAL domain-containing protein (putative c-di-GMP-specific phosphodiesterase class I)